MRLPRESSDILLIANSGDPVSKSVTSFGLSQAERAVGALHNRVIFSRRVQVLADAIASKLPGEASVLDVGAGSGDMAVAILSSKPSLKIEGVDVLVRPGTAIPVREFDGEHLPHSDGSFDYAILVDVLHHTDNPGALLAEVGRVARRIIIKDHYRDGLLAGTRLRLMDWVGNAAHGVRLPYNYLSRAEWNKLWASGGFRVVDIDESFQLYAQPLDLVFGRGLHFIATIEGGARPVQSRDE
jgi:SAM-dependent methyltransferase